MPSGNTKFDRKTATTFGDVNTKVNFLPSKRCAMDISLIGLMIFIGYQYEMGIEKYVWKKAGNLYKHYQYLTKNGKDQDITIIR